MSGGVCCQHILRGRTGGLKTDRQYGGSRPQATESDTGELWQIFIYSGEAQRGQGVCESAEGEYGAPGRISGIGACGGDLVRRPSGYHELSGKYDEKYRKWAFETLPFLPENFKYEVIPGVKKQYDIVKGLLLRQDVDTIYVCTDSGREGEYIYRLVAMMAGVKGKEQKRVWIDSQTEEEILRGIREAKDLSSMTIWPIPPTCGQRKIT